MILTVLEPSIFENGNESTTLCNGIGSSVYHWGNWQLKVNLKEVQPLPLLCLIWL